MTPSKPLTPTERRCEQCQHLWASHLLGKMNPCSECPCQAYLPPLDATQAVEPPDRPECTDHVGASWCPNHGSCRCGRVVHGDGNTDRGEAVDDCPLHGDFAAEPLAARSSSAPAELDAAWREAKAALPAKRYLRLTEYGTTCIASSNRATGHGYEPEASGEGPTPAAALRALARRLTSSPENPA